MRYGPRGRSAWWRMGERNPIPDDLGILLPDQTGLQHATHLPMARLAAALLIDAVRCLHTPPDRPLHQEALRYLLGPSHQETLPCEQACQLAGIEREHLRRRLRAAGYWWDATCPLVTIRIGRRRAGGRRVA
jgi:hypothetical protein